MTAPLDLIVVLRKLGACPESLAWLEKRRAKDPGASFAKRWAEAVYKSRSWVDWAHTMSGGALVCLCFDCEPEDGEIVAMSDDVQRGLHAAFLRVATPAEIEAARMVRR